jgi:predicted Holliday junction resolvase-like endonuclease
VLHSATAIAARRSVAQSRSTLKGQLAEQMAPLLPGFAYNPSDARFLGDPIDYVIFHGYTDVKDDAGDPDQIEIVILEVKCGSAKLSSTQRAIAAAVDAGRVRFEVARITAAGTDVRVTSPAPRTRASRTTL